MIQKDPVRLSKLRQTSQAAFTASSFSSWFLFKICKNKQEKSVITTTKPRLAWGRRKKEEEKEECIS